LLFINPAQEKFGGFLSRYIPVGIPVAIGCLAAYLKKHGIKVRVVDEELVDITPSVLRQLVDGLEKPYIFGLSCLTAHVVRAYQLAEMIKAEFPDAIVVAGGLHPTALPEEAPEAPGAPDRAEDVVVAVKPLVTPSYNGEQTKAEDSWR